MSQRAWVAVNTGMTGLSPTTGPIREFAAVAVVRDGGRWFEAGRFFSQIPVAPSPGHAGRSDVLTNFSEWLSATTGPPAAFIAHGAAVNRALLPELHEINAAWLCTLRLSMRLWPCFRDRSIESLCHWLGVETTVEPVPHEQFRSRALAANTMALLHGELLEISRNEPGIVGIESLADYCWSAVSSTREAISCVQ